MIFLSRSTRLGSRPMNDEWMFLNAHYWCTSYESVVLKMPTCSYIISTDSYTRPIDDFAI